MERGAAVAQLVDDRLVDGARDLLDEAGVDPGDGPAAARDAAYAAADLITCEGRQLRRAIALRAVERIG